MSTNRVGCADDLLDLIAQASSLSPRLTPVRPLSPPQERLAPACVPRHAEDIAEHARESRFLQIISPPNVFFRKQQAKEHHTRLGWYATLAGVYNFCPAFKLVDRAIL